MYIHVISGQSVCVDESLQRELIQQKKQQLLHEVLLSKQQLQKQISISSKVGMSNYKVHFKLNSKGVTN